MLDYVHTRSMQNRYGLLLLPLLLSACSGFLSTDNIPFVYRVDVQQGNVVTQDMLAQLKPGMDKNKVTYIMGSPLITDVFHQDRWDYVYTFKKGGGKTSLRRVSLFFEDDVLSRIDGDVKTASGKIMVTPRRDEMVEVPKQQDANLVNRLKNTIGLGDEEAVPQSSPPKQATKPVNEPEKLGFFGRLRKRLGFGHEEPGSTVPEVHRDPTDPDAGDNGRL